MRIPRRLKIRRSIWGIYVDTSIMWAHNFRGVCYPKRKQIYLSPFQEREELEETMIHELLHACWPDDEVGYRTEETIVGKLAPVLYRALKDGKMLASGKVEAPIYLNAPKKRAPNMIRHHKKRK